MTQMTVPVAAGTARRARRSDLGWNIVRQHRLALIGLAIVFAGFGLRLVLTGIPLHAAYAQYLSQHCVTQRHPACGRLLNDLGGSWVMSYGGMVVLPGLIGVFAGAPLVARDFETGAYRFWLAQSVSGRRQLAAKLLVIGAIVLLGSCLLGLLTMWCLAPLHRIGLSPYSGISYWEPGYFNITAVTLPAWALLDFCLGVLAGALIKRSVPAMAVTLAGVIILAILGTGFAAAQYHPVAQRLLSLKLERVRSTPLLGPSGDLLRVSHGVPVYRGKVTEVNNYPDGWPGPHGSWQVTGWFAGPGGQRLSGQATQSMLNRIPVPVATAPARLRAWLGSRHVTYWIGYQPASRYWLFQAAAAVILITAAAAAALLAVRLATRRT